MGWLTVTEASEYADCHPSLLWAEIEEGSLHLMHRDGRNYIEKDELTRWWKTQPQLWWES